MTAPVTPSPIRGGDVPRPRVVVFILLLVAATVAELAVLAFVADRVLRATGGLVLMAVIVWAAMELGAVRVLQVRSRAYAPERRFHRLRAQVQELLEEVRRLNWVAVIGEGGFQSREAAEQEREALERRLHELVDAITEAVGQESSTQETGDGPG